MDGTSIGPYLPPIPIPGVAKTPSLGANKIKINEYLMTFYDFYFKQNIINKSLKKLPGSPRNSREPSRIL